MIKCSPMRSVASAEAIVAAPTTTAPRAVTPLLPSCIRAVTSLASVGRTTRTMKGDRPALISTDKPPRLRDHGQHVPPPRLSRWA